MNNSGKTFHQIGILNSVTSLLIEPIPESNKTILDPIFFHSSPYGKTSLSDLIDSFEYLINMHHDETIPIRYASECSKNAFGVLGYIFLNSSTIQEAIDSFSQDFSLFQEQSDVHFIKGSQTSCIEYKILGKCNFNRKIDNELTLALICNLFRQAIDNSWAPKYIEFMHKAPKNQEHYKHFFQCPIKFDAPQNSMYFSNELLKYQIKSSDPLLKQIMINLLQDIGFKRKEEIELIKKIESIVQENIDEYDISLEFIAASLNLPSWTLKRKLLRANTTFSKVLDETLKKIATQLLQDQNKSISEIAFYLGYADASSFSKAFTRWYGICPREWTKRLN